MIAETGASIASPMRRSAPDEIDQRKFALPGYIQQHVEIAARAIVAARPRAEDREMLDAGFLQGILPGAKTGDDLSLVHAKS